MLLREQMDGLVRWGTPVHSTSEWDRRGLWEQQYQDGRWQYLRSIEEMGRYAIISAYIRRFSKNARVLDVGCGEGILSECLDWNSVSIYTGIDLSESAIAAARVPRDRATLIVGDMEAHSFPTNVQFDVVVLNEVLYSAHDPKALLDKCVALLPASGILVISMYHLLDPSNPFRTNVDAIWNEIDSRPWRKLDEVALTNLPSQRTWRIRVLCAPPRVV